MKAQIVPSTIHELTEFTKTNGFDSLLILCVVFSVLVFSVVIIWAVREIGKKNVDIVLQQKRAEECEERHAKLEKEFKSVTGSLRAKLEQAEKQIRELYDKLVN